MAHQLVAATSPIPARVEATAIPAMAPMFTLDALLITPPFVTVTVELLAEDEDVDADPRQLVSSPARTVTGGSPFVSPSSSVIPNCMRVSAVKLVHHMNAEVDKFWYCCKSEVSVELSGLSGAIFSLYGGRPPVQARVVRTHCVIVNVSRLIEGAPPTVGANNTVKRANARVNVSVLEVTVVGLWLVVLKIGGTGYISSSPLNIW